MNNTPPSLDDLAAVSTAADLGDCMKRLLRSRGNESLRELEEWGMQQGRSMPKSSLGDALSGKRPPYEQMLCNYLASQGVKSESDVKPWLDALARVAAAQPGGRGRSVADRDLGPVPARNFFVETDEVDEIYKTIKNVQEQVWLLGTTLSQHVSYLQPALRQAIANRRSVRILLIKPGGAAMDMSVLRAGPPPKGMTKQEQEEQLGSNLAILRRLAHAGPRLEVRLIDYLAPYTLYAYDPGLETGKMVMRLGSFHGEHDLRPTFQIERGRDVAWFEYFYEQFVTMWKTAEPYDLLGDQPG